MEKVRRLVEQVKYIFDRGQKVQLLLLLFIVIFTTFVELLGVSAILPLIEVMMDPGCVQTKPYLKYVYDLFGFDSVVSFFIFLAVALMVVYWVKNILTAISYNMQYKFTFSNQKRMAYKMLECYLNQPYFFHLSHNSAELIRSINILLIPALAVFLLGAAAYMCAGLGSSPYDALPFIISGHVRRFPFKIVRMLWDICFMAAGFVLGGDVGIVTILVAFFLGPIITGVQKKLEVLIV